MRPPTVSQIEAAIKVAHVVYEAIVAAGAQGIPSGHLYAHTMNALGDLATYESCISLLLKSGLVKRENHVLTAISPR